MLLEIKEETRILKCSLFAELKPELGEWRFGWQLFQAQFDEIVRR